jgi:KpsF/GutQ family protein
MAEDIFKKLVAHCKEYGFVFQSSEIYDGLGAVYDYGQNGVELKNNIKKYWWDSMVMLNENIVGIDSAIFMHPTDAFHGELGMVRKDDIVIVISKSGHTEELVQLIPMFKRINVTLIGMLGEKDSKLGRECDIVLNVNVKEEACPYDLAPTSSTTAALVMGDALAITLLEMRGFTAEDFALLHPGGSLGKRLSLKIEELMIKGKDIPVVSEKASLKDTILEITSKRLGTTCVVNENGILTGIITDGDLRRLLEKTMDIKNLAASEVMTKKPKTITKKFAGFVCNSTNGELQNHIVNSSGRGWKT